MRSRLVATAVLLGAALAAGAHASVATQQWSTLGLKVSAEGPEATQVPGPVLDVRATLAGRPDDALRVGRGTEETSLIGPPVVGGVKERRPGSTAPVPEPGTISLLAMGLIGAGLGMRRRKSR
jgi:hypothetical protein